MAIIEICIRNSKYKIACKEGEQEYLSMLAGRINSRIKDLGFNEGSDALMLLMISLVLEDELHEMRKELGDSDIQCIESILKRTKSLAVKIKND
jgi:cell division protein ZapA (FtsZ GTPase activity inhibitor)